MQFPVLYWPEGHIEQAVQVPLAFVQVLSVQLLFIQQSPHDAHVVSVDPEQPPVFYRPKEHDEQAVQVPFIAAVQVFTAQY